MKKIILTTVLLATLTAVNAQDTKSADKAKEPTLIQQVARERAEQRTLAMATELSLSEEQIGKVRVINERYTIEAEKLKQAGADPESTKERMRILRENRDQGFKAALTEDQYTKMMDLRKDSKEENEGAGGKTPHNE